MGVFNFLHVVLDNKKQLMEYVGTAWATDLRSISRLAWLACFPLHVPITFLILDGMNSKASVVDRPTAVGSRDENGSDTDGYH
jgi:hypothetical protein